MKTSVDKSDQRPRRSFLRRLWSIAQWTINLVVLICLLLVFTPAGDWLGDALIDVDPLAPADYIVVLGGNYERGVEAARLYRQRWARKVIITCTNAGAKTWVNVLKTYGVPGEDILVDNKAIRTASHPETVAELPGVDPASDRFIIVTSPYHTSRSRACFLQAGYRNILMRSPGWRAGGEYGGSSWVRRASSLCEGVYEALAWGMYAVLGWV